MTTAVHDQVTRLILDVRDGAPGAWDQLLPLVYEELHRLARRHLRNQRAGHTLSTTALVHEAYLRLVDRTRVSYADRAHFFAVAARAMRQVLIDYARRYRTAKRGGGIQPITLDEAAILVEERSHTLLSLDEALTRLATLNERLARVVEYRFFGGLSVEETASVLGVTERTVRRDWIKARLWLYDRLHEGTA